MELITERIKMRLVNASDLKWIHELNSLKEVDRYNTLGIPEDFNTTESVMMPLIEANVEEKVMKYTFVIEDRDSNQPIGLLGFWLDREKYKSAEVWYKLFPEYWGKGFATESVNRVLEFGFESLKLHRIHAGCAVDNIASVKVLEKVGMTLEGRARQTLPLSTGWSDHYNYALLESEFKKG